jgi:CHAT domain-containing protein/tetratricopeptide (TPR) repeat protein
MKKILVLAALLVIFPGSRLREEPPCRGKPEPRLNESLHPTDVELLRRTGMGRFEEVVSLGRSRITAGCRSCLPYILTVKAAAQIGELEPLAEELQTRLRENPLDDYLLAGNAFALREARREEQALQLMALAVRNGVDCPRVYKSFVELSHMLGRTRDAEKLVERLLTERPHDAYLLFSRAYSWTRWGDTTRASFAFQEAMIKAPPFPLTYYFLAVSLVNAAELSRALTVCRTGLRITGQTALPEIRAALLNVMSVALELSGREVESLEAFEKALKLARDYNLAFSEAEILLRRASLMESRGKSDLGRRNLDEARTYRTKLYFDDDRARFLIRLGSVLLGAGEEISAEEALRQGMELAQSLHDPFLELEGRIQLGFIQLNRGNREAAREIFELAIEDAARIRAEDLHGYALSGLAATQEQVGNYRDALATYRKVWLLAKTTGGRRTESLALSNIGLVCFRMAAMQEALLYAVRANQLARLTGDLRLQVGVQQGLAAILAGLRNFSESQKIYQAALDIGSRLSSPELQALLLSGWARVTLELGESEQAKEGFEQALKLARSLENEMVAVQALSGLGLLFWRQGDLEKATRRFEEALSLIESTRQSIVSRDDRMSYLETRTQIFDTLVAVLMQRHDAAPNQGYHNRAFEVVERSRARALLDLLNATSAGDLDRGSSRRTGLGGGRPVTSLELERFGLGDNEVYLEYSLGERRSFLFLLSRHQTRVVHLPPRNVVEQSVRDFLATVASPPRTPGNPFERHIERGRDLFDMLLGPVRDVVAQSRHVIISPDGILHFLPFGALVTGQSSSPYYLLEQATLSYVPSATVLLELKGRPRGVTRSMDFFGVAQSRASLEPPSLPSLLSDASSSVQMGHIPFAIDEVEAASGFFAPGKRRVLTNQLATERAVKSEDLRRFRILHFATHALADGAEPERSAIYLAADSTADDDGALQMAEILDLTLASDLVVLSGCQTGLGRLMRAEGIVGLPWAFLSSGSSSVIVSLWNVNDRSTADLMRFFYENLQQGNDRATALENAQKTMLTSERWAYRHPFYWAPFVLVGLVQ